MEKGLINFPPAEMSDEDGLIYVGGEINAENLLRAYKKGIFPWPIKEDPFPVLWFSPLQRGILKLENFHVSKSLRKFLKKNMFTYTFNKAFSEVIYQCQISKNRTDKGTWITKSLTNGYFDLFKKGHAYSVEVWKDEVLVGGLYGVTIGNYVSAESMFYLESNASKCAIVYLMESLRERKIDWVDVQMVTPITGSFGAVEIRRLDFLKFLDDYNLLK